MRILPEETQCMLIDLQERLLPAMTGAEACEERAVLLANGLRTLEVPMLITQQYTKGLGMSVPSIYEAAGMQEYFDKRTFSCAQDDAILKEVCGRNRKNVLVCGVEAHVCVLQTCIDLKAMGFQPILVTDVADQVNLSSEYFSRQFKKETGLSIKDYIIQAKVDAAKDLLARSDIPVSLIALEMGYDNFSHFTQIFKKICGVTPSDYRKDCRERG